MGDEARALAQRKGSALEGITWRFLNSSSHNSSGFHFYSFPDYISAAWKFSYWEMFACPMSFPVSSHRPHPNPCALTLAIQNPACLQGTVWVHVPVCRWKMKGQAKPGRSRKVDAGPVDRQKSG